VVLDEDVCPWCRVAAVRLGEDDLLVAYRDHDAAEVRDVSLVRRRDGRWEEPSPLHRDGWRIAGCPVNGPALTAAAERMAAAWFTAADSEPRVLVAVSTEDGSFGEPRRVEAGDPLGRVDVELFDDGTTWVCWLERVPGGAAVRLGRIDPDGRASEARTIGTTAAGPEGGFPRMARTGERLYVAWAEPGPPSRIRLASLGR
jgi:hypothetical protein